MEHQTAGVRPTRLRRAVSQPLDRVESSRGSRGFMTSPRPVARAPCSFGSLGACPGHNYRQPYYGCGCLFPFLDGTTALLSLLRCSRGSDPRLVRLTMGELLDQHNCGATPCIKDRPRPRVRPSHSKTSPQNRQERGQHQKDEAANLRRPIRLSLPRWLRYADSRDGLGAMPDRSPAHICGGPPKYLRQKSPERDTRF
jgi:hypothetical protein